MDYVPPMRFGKAGRFCIETNCEQSADHLVLWNVGAQPWPEASITKISDGST